MSQYLIDQVKETPQHPALGPTRACKRRTAKRTSRRFQFLCSDTNKIERVPASAMFIFIGALPRTDWLAGVVERDDRGFLLTSQDFIREGQHPERLDARKGSFPARDDVPGNFRSGRRAAWIGKARGFWSRRGVSCRAVHPSISEQSLNGRKIRIGSADPRSPICPTIRSNGFSARRKRCTSKRGTCRFVPGEPADAMFVILEGQLQARGELGGETVVIPIKAPAS